MAGLLGHSQPSTTRDIYTHAFDKNKRQQAKLCKADWRYKPKTSGGTNVLPLAFFLCYIDAAYNFSNTVSACAMISSLLT